MSHRRGLAERVTFYLVIRGIGALAMIVGGTVDAVRWARRLRRRPPAESVTESISHGTP